MRIRDTSGAEEDQINLMPLIDMVFLLLIFFLVATTISQEERESAVQLPGTAQTAAISAPPKQIIVNVLEDGSYRVAGRQYNGEELGELLRRSASDQPQREVLIRADERSLHRYFAAAARMCREAGISEVKIGYIVESAPPQPSR